MCGRFVQFNPLSTVREIAPFCEDDMLFQDDDRLKKQCGQGHFSGIVGQLPDAGYLCIPHQKNPGSLSVSPHESPLFVTRLCPPYPSLKDRPFLFQCF